MGSIRFEGVRFAAFSDDHEPMHVHGSYAEVVVVVELHPDRTVSLADRTDAVRPPNAKRSDVKHVLVMASEHFEELVAVGERIMTKAARMITTDAEIDTAIGKAKLLDGEPLATTAQYIPTFKVLIVGLTNGRRLVLPIEDLQGLETATAKQLRNVEILSLGTEINFPDIDLGFYVPSLIEGVYGNRRWMSELGKRGGQAKTEAKQIASRANGAKGGRPKKAAPAGAFVKRREVRGGRPKSAPPGALVRRRG
jgi:hypothetical protein